MKIRSLGGNPPGVVVRATAVCAFLATALIVCASLLFPLAARAEGSICAEVKIQIDQKVSLERQAFDAKLQIRNGLEGVQVERIDVNLVFKDANGLDAHTLFFNRLDSVENITGSVDDGTGNVAASTTGEAHWLIIPSQGAGGVTGAGLQYLVGATVTYRMTGETEDRTVEVIPETITVRPQPLLDLDYFLPGPVYGDDPFTAEVEPPVPFTLGVRITNRGAGVASHASIESAQPRITENEQGLLVGFEIAGSFVDDQAAQPSLLIDFGDIAPGASRMGRWNMLTTLSGQFHDFSAEYTHADSLGGELTSLLGTITPYLLTHDVLVDLPGRDNVRDFLAQTSTATQDTDTYRVYESDGASTEVVQQFGATFDGSTFSFPASAQGTLVYARSSISFDGQGQSINALRSDGQPVAPANVWFSKRRDASGESWLYFVNLFDASGSACPGTCSYTLDYENAPPEASIAGVVYEDANANGVQDPGEPGLAGVSVVASDGASPHASSSVADGSFEIANLSSGTYTLSVGEAQGHYDGQHVAGSAGGVVGATSIGGIVLGASIHATGYQFAKVPLPDQRVADLGIVGFTASTLTPRAAETFTITTQVTNLGPDSSAAVVTQPLPSDIDVLSANPSSGTFEAGTGEWVIGELAAGATATLSLQVRANQQGPVSIVASVINSDASTLDPLPENNVATLNFNVDPATELELTVEVRKETRILALSSCGLENLVDTCDEDRMLALQGALNEGAIEFWVAASPAEFRRELRGGHWNVYWLDGSASLLDDELVGELRMAVLRGESLIVDNAQESAPAGIDTLVGASYTGARQGTTAETMTFVANAYLNLPPQSVSGARQTYQVATASVLATYPDGQPAVLHAAHGDGHAFLFAFDLVAMLNGNPSYATLFDQLTSATAPLTRTFSSEDAYLPLSVHLNNAGDPLSVTESLTVAAPAHIIHSTPTPDVSSDIHAVWQASLDTSAEFSSSVGLRVATEGGSSTVSVDVNRTGGSEVIAHEELPILVRDTDQSFVTLGASINAVPAVGSTDKTLRRTAARELSRAATARNEGNQKRAITKLLDSVAALEQIASANTSAIRIDLAWLLQALDREWYRSLSACGTPADPVVEDSGIEFDRFAKREGLVMRQLDQGGFEWRLGTNVNGTNRSVGGITNPQIGHEYQWSMSYLPDGTGTFSVSDQGFPILAETYTPPRPRAPKLRRGNGLEVSVEAAKNSAGSDVSVILTRLQGIDLPPVPIMAGSSTSTTRASRYFYGESMSQDLSLEGTVVISVPSPLTLPTAELTFRVNAGTTSCRNPSR
jgi:hypothetical protein